jgi:hypothetical protein
MAPTRNPVARGNEVAAIIALHRRPSSAAATIEPAAKAASAIAVMLRAAASGRFSDTDARRQPARADSPKFP